MKYQQCKWVFGEKFELCLNSRKAIEKAMQDYTVEGIIRGLAYYTDELGHLQSYFPATDIMAVLNSAHLYEVKGDFMIVSPEVKYPSLQEFSELHIYAKEFNLDFVRHPIKGVVMEFIF